MPFCVENIFLFFKVNLKICTKCSLGLRELFKIKKKHPSIYQDKLHNIMEHCSNHLCIFIDDSKNSDKMACAAILNKKIAAKAVLEKNSIFTTEDHAVNVALNISSKSSNKTLIMFSESISFLLLLKKCNPSSPESIGLHVNSKEILAC